MCRVGGLMRRFNLLAYKLVVAKLIICTVFFKEIDRKKDKLIAN